MNIVAKVVGLFAVGAAVFSGSASAAVLFSDNFNAYYGGNSNSTQYGTGLTVEANGSLPGWRASGNGSLHAVNRSTNAASPDFAIMFYDGNQMTYMGNGTGLAANALGVTYTVSYEQGPAAYSTQNQATQAGDFLTFLLNDSLSQFQVTRSYTDVSTGFKATSFTYVGTGNGNLYLSVTDGIDGNLSFGGEIDNLSVSTATVSDSVAVPEPASILLLGAGMLGAASIRARKRRA